MNLDDIEKGQASLPIDTGKAITEILRLTAANHAMLNTILNVLIEHTELFKDGDEVSRYIAEASAERFHQVWADVLNQVAKK